MQPYLAASQASPAPNDILRRERVREVGYYLDSGRFLVGSPEILGKILDGELWRRENAADAPLYLQRQVLAANIALTLERPADAVRATDKALSLIASLKAPQSHRFVIASALSESIATLTDVGETDRAYGLYRAANTFIARALPPRSFEAALYRLREAQLLQQAGDLGRATAAAEAAAQAFGDMEIETGVREAHLARALTLKAVLCGLANDRPCAAAALAANPFAPLYAQAGRSAQDYDEVGYLAVRAFTGALDGRPDPVVTAALRTPSSSNVGDPHVADAIAFYRAAGLAFAAPAGDARRDALLALGARAKAAAGRTSGVFGAWYRPGAADRLLIGAALMAADNPSADPDTLFALFQLAARTGPGAFDADALTALGQTTDPLARRSVHQALRLLARRDHYEQGRIRAMATRALAAPDDEASPFDHDVAARLRLRDYNDRIEQAAKAVAVQGVSVSGANLTSLKAFQALLKPNEAALAVTAAPGGLAYLCVRRDRVVHALAPADLAKARLDQRLVQSALTATYPPDETLDGQFPVAAAMRLYDRFIRPFDGCLRADDRIVWLSSIATLNLPISVLLEHAPPTRGAGYDLTAADWLVRHHAVSYAGSAAMVTAARAGGRRATPDFDFLGIGDPQPAVTPNAGPRAADLAALPPLPETRRELEASARGFSKARLLLGADASEAGFRRELVGAYRYLSFATHGLMRDDVADLAEPALVLSAGSGVGGGDDGLLTASEIADLNLQAQFVALSACNTANFGLARAAEDLPALASAFAVAGVPGTLATLWPVNSETSERVVAPIFAALRDGQTDPADALVAAQRGFLAAPPGRAFAHPRFWAPFVILGDGGAPAAARPEASRPRLIGVEAITRHGGEVLGLRQTPQGLAARYIGDANAEGRHGAGVRLATPDGRELWRAESPRVGATRVLLPAGAGFAAGGYQVAADGRFTPTLETFDANGRRGDIWRAAPAGRDAILLGGTTLEGGRSVLAVGEPDLRASAAQPPAKLHLLSFAGSGPPRPLAEIETPAGLSVSEAALAGLGDGLLVTYGDPFARLPAPAAATEDDYDSPLCVSQPRSRLELRDPKTGALRRARDLPGYVFSAAVSDHGRVLLGGLHVSGCGAETRAVVVALGAELQARTLYEDASLGASRIRALLPAADGGVFAVGAKESLVDTPPTTPAGARSTPAAQRAESGLVLRIARDEAVSPPILLDTGGDVFLSAAASSRRGELVVGGSVGGGAALVRFALKP